MYREKKCFVDSRLLSAQFVRADDSNRRRPITRWQPSRSHYMSHYMYTVTNRINHSRASRNVPSLEIAAYTRAYSSGDERLIDRRARFPFDQSVNDL